MSSSSPSSSSPSPPSPPPSRSSKPPRKFRQTHAIGTLTAKLTAKLGHKQPANTMLATIRHNWKRIAPQDFLQHAHPVHLSKSPDKTVLTIAVDQAFAPIALHRTTPLLNNINAFLGSDAVQFVKLQQTSKAMSN